MSALEPVKNKTKALPDDDRLLRQKNAVIRMSRMLSDRGLLVRTFGNVSRRSDKDHFIITPSGIRYEDLTTKRIVRVNLKKLTYRGKIRPSSEMAVHAAIYQMREDAGFIIHTHQPYASCVSVLGDREIELPHEMIPGGEDTITHLPVAPYARPGSKELAEHVADTIERFPDCKGVILENHGVVCWGRNERVTRARAESVEILCYTYLADVCHTAIQYGVQERFSSERLQGAEILYADPQTPERVKRFHRMIYAARPDVNSIVHAASEAEIIVSERFTELRPLFDDFAQIAGYGIRIPGNARENTGEGVLDIRKQSNVVFHPGDGAFCLGKTREDALSCAKIVDKACIAQIALTRLGKGHYLPLSHCKKVNRIYKKDYERLAMKYASKSSTGTGREK